MKEENKDSGQYIRVGTTLYKIVRRPLMSGDFIEERRVWNYETLRQDHSKDFISQIEKYDGFCSVPDHIDYKRSIGTFLNQYEPIPCQPIPGKCPLTLEFLRHIFGEQLEMGLDYLQLLYLKPLTKLPIILLVSNERNTGKTTFLNFLKAIFAGNMTFNTNEDFHSQFNSDWANKLIVGVDEALLDRREDSERIKNLSTALSYKAEAKGRDRQEVEFFAKFVLCSNNEACPIIVEKGETRYWVRKIHSIEKKDMRIENCSFHEAASKLEKEYAIKPDSFSFQGKTVISNEVKSDAPILTIQNIVPITHPKLVAWVQERKIDLDLANLYCREVHYRNRDNESFSIGFRNDNGGYELSSPLYFKGCISPKDITTVKNNSSICLVFEGFWDFLSYLAIQKIEKSKHDVAILNSVANVQKAMDFLKSHREIYTYLDNDEAGRKATELIKSRCVSVNNRSSRYAGFKDLNDYLRQKPIVKPEIKKKKLGLRR